jgi:hypothetical protein
MEFSTIARVAQTAIGIVKDPTAWTGSIVSTISLKVTSFALMLPASLEGWAALAASVATLVYVISKTVILWRSHDKKALEQSDAS